jgi:hypothetical protein
MTTPAQPDQKWKRFEKIIHAMHQQLAPAGAIVTRDDKVMGCESQVLRQLDVTIRANIASYSLFIVIECRDEMRSIDVNGIGEFATKLHDVKANKGILISTSGFTEGAVTMAQARGIATRTYIDTENADWRKDVAIVVLVNRHELRYQIGFANIPNYHFDLPQNVPFQEIELFSPAGEPLGRVDVIVDKLWIDEAVRLYKVQYQPKFVEIDFFRSLGTANRSMLEFWYRDEAGNASQRVMDILAESEKWRNEYWENSAIATTTKLSDWAYEAEYRAILQGAIIDFCDPTTRKLEFHFSDLEGIIFGARTSTADKLSVMKIVAEKCKAAGRTSFSFQQARFSNETGRFEIVRLNLLEQMLKEPTTASKAIEDGQNRPGT